MFNNWDIDNMEHMEDDCLEFIRLIFVDFYLHKYTKIFNCIILAFHVPIWAEQFYQYFRTFDLLMVAQYGPGSFVFLYAFMSMIIPMAYEDLVRTFVDLRKTTYWSLNAASKEVKQKILKQAKYTLLIAQRKNQWEVIYQVTFFKKYFSDYADVFIVIFYATLGYLLLPMLSMVNLMVYCTIHGCFQSYIINERIIRITENYSKRTELINDEIYQRQVFQRLRFCIKGGTNLKRIFLESIALINNLVIIYTVLGMLLLFCFIGSWHFIEDVYYPSLLMLITTSGFCCLIVVEAGQMVEDLSMDVYYTVTVLPWYTFNIKNQKTLLCIMLYASVPLEVSPFRDFPVNRTLIVKFYKVGCSVYALTANMGQRIHF